jgi:hypothetical protein
MFWTLQFAVAEGDLVDGGADKRFDFVCAYREIVGADKN